MYTYTHTDYYDRYYISGEYHYDCDYNDYDYDEYGHSYHCLL